jgi:hypothetical protein
MWSPKVFKFGSLVAFGALALAGCSADYAQNGTSTRVLIVQSVHGGAPLSSDVRQATNICPDLVNVIFGNQSKNPRAPTSFRDDIIVERYEVRYIRSDGRGVEGVDVPFTISGNLSAQVSASGTTTVAVEVVRRQAKVEPPLSNLVSDGGPFLLSIIAEMTFHARTTTGEVTNPAVGRLQIDFADFVNAATDTTCPTSS